MIRAEWKKLFKNKTLPLVLVAIALIPTIYCWLYLSSLWNTYSKVTDIPVAVVNHDVDQQLLQGKTIQIGHNLVASLKTSKTMDYHFVKASTAHRGLASGRYYLIVTVPKNFSQNATTLLSKHPQSMRLYYRISSGRNFVISKMITGATTAIEHQVGLKVTQMYVGVLLRTVHQTANGFGVAGTGDQRLVNGLNQVQTATQKLATGQARLTAGMNKISFAVPNGSVTGQLKQGLNQLGQVSACLAAGQTVVNTGLSQLAQGGAQGAHRLLAGQQRLLALNDSTKNIDRLAQPVQSTLTDDSAVPNNGTGMSPFAVAIGLFVGALAMGTMFDAYTPVTRPKSAINWWLAKFSVIGVVCGLQTGFLGIALKMGLGLKTMSDAQLWLMLFVGSVLFLSVIYGFRLLLGNFGIWLTTVFLVLQLGSSGGIYPVQLTSNFATVLNPFLPMTYLIDGLRHAISLGGSITTDLWTMTLFIVGVQLLIFGKFLLATRQKTFESLVTK